MVRNNSKAPPLEVAMYGGMACKESLDKDKKVLSHQDQMRDLFSTIKRGGSGDQINGPWKANPTPFDNPIDLEDFSIHNILGFHFSILMGTSGLYISTGERFCFCRFQKIAIELLICQYGMKLFDLLPEPIKFSLENVKILVNGDKIFGSFGQWEVEQ